MTRSRAGFGLLFVTLALVGLLAPWLQGYSTTGMKWPGSTVLYYVNPSSVWVSPNAAVSAVQTAAAGWNDQTRASLELVYAGTTTGASLLLNNKNEVFFRNASNGSNIAEVLWWADGSGKLVDADIVFWEEGRKFFAGSGCYQGVYIENIAIHELGHILGLRHSSDSSATMWPSTTGWCDRSWLTLAPDDIAGLESLYPPGSGGGGTPTNTTPSVSISSPANSASFANTTSITFAASANDSQDGNLTASLKWTSNQVGQIGTGGSFSRTLSAGTHTITAAVTDSGGLSSSQQVTIVVSASTSPVPAPSSASLSASGYKVKGMQKADLSWRGLTGSNIDVYRDGALVMRVPNNGAATDSLNKRGGGAYAYRVCDAGTTTCSNTASVSF